MTYETVQTERVDGVGLITLDRPKVLNALNTELLTELADAVQEFDRDPDVRCIALLGSDRAFAAGADISQMVNATPTEMVAGNAFASIEQLRDISTPIIAGVSGYCLGGGCELAMACDLIIAADTAQFGQPEINLGIIPGAGGTQRLTRAVGKAVAMDMVLTGRTLSADEAHRAGLVARVVAAEAWRDETIAVGRTIAAKGPLALRMARECVNAAFDSTLRTGIEFERRSFHVLFGTDDQREGMQAFMDKRKPAFTGH